MLDIQAIEATAREMLQKAINDRVEELAKEKYFMTMKELEKYLNLSRPTIMKCFVEKGLRYYRAGDRYLFKREEVDSFLDAVTEEMSITQNNLLSFGGLKGGESNEQN